jgi:hypothetical protein
LRKAGQEQPPAFGILAISSNRFLEWDEKETLSITIAIPLG